MKYCIHDRSKKQVCRLCRMRSKCCKAPVENKYFKYFCTDCNNQCEIEYIHEK